MPFTKVKCPHCGKVAESEREFVIEGKLISRMKCGHLMAKDQLVQQNSWDNVISMDGKRLFPYQKVGGKFMLDSGGRAILGDEMGVGKMVQTLAMLAVNPDMMPFVGVVTSSLKVQWQHEAMRWIGEDTMIQVIDSAKDFVLPGMNGYIVSYDLLPKLMNLDPKAGKKVTRRTNDEILSETPKPVNTLATRLLKLGVKTVVLDECQQIKNSEAARTIATRKLCAEFPYVIATSGTPIRNNAAEFFPVLNIIRPDVFPSEAQYIHQFCETYWTGSGYKIGGIRYPKEFAETIKPFYLRRTRDEVLPELPKIQRNFSFHEMGPEVERMYIAEFKRFQDDMNSGAFDDDSFGETSNILQYLTKMRHIVGLSKINPCIDHCMEFLGSCDRKLTIFFHHKDVGEILFQKLSSVLTALELDPPLRIIAEMDSEARQASVREFTNNPRKRIELIATKVGGEGLNLQVCSDYILLERQWNPAIEEQAEARFPRPGQQAQSINGTYFVAIGTVDEFLSEIVERKREFVHSTLDGRESEITWDQSSIMKELVETLSMNGGKRWSI